jgi:hypothetical protein
MNMHTTKGELLEEVFSMQSTPKLHREDQRDKDRCQSHDAVKSCVTEKYGHGFHGVWNNE